jgi:hypothetical protein
MTKIEKFVKEQFGIVLTPYQLEIIAMLATGKDVKAIDVVKRGGKTTAYKAALAYLQDGLKVTEAGSEN